MSDVVSKSEQVKENEENNFAEEIHSESEDASNLENRGVCYLSRIPPFMSPQVLRQRLSQFGEIGRIYLSPEDKATFRKRRKFQGNSRRNFVDGWVEFMDKKNAKLAAMALNNQPMGGKKRNQYHDDLWNVKFLKGFKWTQLTEKIAHAKAVREQKIRTEMTQAKKERKFFIDKVNEAKAISAIEQKRKRKLEQDKE